MKCGSCLRLKSHWAATVAGADLGLEKQSRAIVVNVVS